MKKEARGYSRRSSKTVKIEFPCFLICFAPELSNVTSRKIIFAGSFLQIERSCKGFHEFSRRAIASIRLKYSYRMELLLVTDKSLSRYSRVLCNASTLFSHLRCTSVNSVLETKITTRLKRASAEKRASGRPVKQNRRIR